MVKYINIYIFILLASCSTSNFTIRKIPIKKSVLSLKGYYFYSSTSVYPNGVVGLYFFYENGVFYNQGISFEGLDKALTYYKDKNNTSAKNYPIEKSYWGVYRTIGDSIVLEQPQSSMGYPIIKHTGKILDDTTFYINTSKEEYQKLKTFENVVYHFKKFEPKPDSTNKFVN